MDASTYLQGVSDVIADDEKRERILAELSSCPCTDYPAMHEVYQRILDYDFEVRRARGERAR